MEQAGASNPLHRSSIVHPADSVLIPVIAPSSISRICLHLQTGVNSCMSVCWCCFFCSPCLKLTCMCQVWGARGLGRYVELWVSQRQLLDRAQQWFLLRLYFFYKSQRCPVWDTWLLHLWRNYVTIFRVFPRQMLSNLTPHPDLVLAWLFLLG